MKERIKTRVGLFILSLVFFSGFCSLTYQVIWERTLKYSFGGDVISASIIVSVFLLGLGIGGYIFRKVRRNALIILAFVELFIGLFGMWSYEIILQINTTLSVLNLKLGVGSLGETVSVFLGTFIFLLLPTILMGGTLPLMLESFVPKTEKNTKFIGSIYGINVLGAVAGTLLPLLIFGTVGLPKTLKLTSLFSLLIGFALFGLAATRKKSTAPATVLPVSGKTALKRQSFFYVVFAFMTGFIALALEILFIRFIGIMHGSSSYSFPTIMSAYLFSMSLGSMFWASVRDRLKQAKKLPYFLLAAVGILVPLSILVFQNIINPRLSRAFAFTNTFTVFSEALARGNYGQVMGTLLTFGLPFLLLILPVVFFSSGVFPTLIKNLSENNVPLGKSTGIIYFSNSAGSTCGSLFTGFLAVPLFGWHTSLILVSLLSMAIGALGFLLFRRFPFDPKKEGIFARLKTNWALVLLILVPIVLFAFSDKNIKFNLATGEYLPETPIVAYEEGMTGVAAVTEEIVSNGKILHVYSNGQYMSALPNHPRHAYLAYLPRMQKKFKSVLLLGLGGGRSLADLLSDDRVETVVAVDWSREMVKIVRNKSIVPFNHDPLSDSRAMVQMSDARKIVKTYASKSIRFDAIIDNLCFPHWPGAGGVKSIQFFRTIKKILKEDGYYYHINNFHKEKNVILRTLCEAFKEVCIHNGMMVICGSVPYSPSQFEVNKILGDQNVLARAPNLFVPSSMEPEDHFVYFQRSLETVNRESLAHLAYLTDEIPSTEYFISLPLLWENLRAGLKKRKTN
jgi:spermidine synthase